MKLLSFLEKKENPIGKAFVLNNWISRKPHSLKAYAEEGYALNAVVYRCIKEITTGAASIDLFTQIGGKDGEVAEISRILTRPNLTQSWVEFLREALSEYLLTGNCFILQSPEVGKPLELYVAPSRYMKIKIGEKGVPSYYEFDNGSFKKQFPVDQVTGISTIIHWKDYSPTDKFWGMSTMSPVSLSADVHNNGLRWNASLLENGAKMSGILEIEGSPSNDAIERLREYFKKAFQGKDNAGNIPVATDGAKFTQIDRSPVDMDFMSTMKETAKYIASAFGVPLPLIDNDSSSFNNIQQAKERLWTDTILPLLDAFLNTLSVHFSRVYGKEISIKYDADSIPALEANRKTKAERLQALVSSGLITINEAREQLGYDPIDGGDTLFLPSSNIPIGMAADTGGTDPAVAKAMGRLGMSKDEIFEATGIGSK